MLYRTKKKIYYFTKRLKEAILDSLAYPLTIVEAASGCGKTTVIKEFFLKYIEKDYQVFCYSCMGEHIKTTWSGICGLLSRVDGQAAEELKQFDITSEDAMPMLALSMEQLKCASPIVLVIDNYHLFRSGLSQKILQALAAHNNENFHIIVLTQPLLKKLSFPLNSKIYYIYEEKFLFHKSDSRSYLQKISVFPDDKTVDFLYESTEGWAAALTVQLESYINTGTFTEKAQISGLIEESFYEQIEDKYKKHLILLSLLEEFSLEQALVLLDIKDIPSGLKRIFAAYRGFIHLKKEEGNYRFHSLLCLFLKDKFKEWPWKEKLDAYKKAGEACIHIKDFVKAALFYERAGEYKRILKLKFSIKDLETLLKRNCKIAESLLTYCPEQALIERPELLMKLTLELFLYGHMVEFKKYSRLLRAAYNKYSMCGFSKYRSILTGIILMESFFLFRDLEKTCEVYRNAAFFLQCNNIDPISIQRAWTFGVPSVIFLFWSEPGKLLFEKGQLSEGIKHYRQLTNNHGMGASVVMEAEILFNRGEDKKSEILCYQALYLAEKYGQDSISICALLILARIAILRGDLERYRELEVHIKECKDKGKELECETACDLCLAFLYTAFGITEKIPSWLANMNSIRTKLNIYAVPFGQVIYARLLLDSATGEQFQGVITELQKEARQQNILFSSVYYFIYSAIEKERHFQHGEAVEDLKNALRLTAADRIYIPFVEHFGELEPLFLNISEDALIRSAIENITRLGRRFCKGKKVIQLSCFPKEQKLTKREQEIAVLLKQGLSAKQVAARLFLSPQTVRSVMKSIYRKLDIHSKVELFSFEL